MKYLFIPLVVVFSGSLLFFTLLGLVTGTRSSIDSLLLASLLIALLMSIPLFGTECTALLATFLEKNQRLAEFERKHFLRIANASFDTRLDLQRYLRWSAFASGVLFVSFFLISLETTNLSLSPPTALALIFFGIMAGLIFTGQSVLRERERTAYYIERFSGELRDYLAKVGPRPDIENFEKALNSYQSLFTYCRIPNIRKRLAQTRLALDRGTKEEIKELGKSLRILSISTEDRNPSLFDAQFNLLVSLLDKIEAEKKDIGEIVASRHDRVKSLLIEMKKPILNRVLPAVLIVMIAYLFYVLSGYRISIG